MGVILVLNICKCCKLNNELSFVKGVFFILCTHNSQLHLIFCKAH